MNAQADLFDCGDANDPSANPSTSGCCQIPLQVTCHCRCGGTKGVIKPGYGVTVIHCRNCDAWLKQISRDAFQFFVVCSIALSRGASLKDIREACDPNGHFSGPLNVALKLLAVGLP